MPRQKLGFVQAAAEGFQIALREGAVIRQAEMYLVQISLVLQRRAGPEADGVAKVVGRQTGHYRVQIDHTDSLMCSIIDHDIIQLCVIVRYTKRQLTCIL